jgi:hypothetical protein
MANHLLLQKIETMKSGGRDPFKDCEPLDGVRSFDERLITFELHVPRSLSDLEATNALVSLSRNQVLRRVQKLLASGVAPSSDKPQLVAGQPLRPRLSEILEVLRREFGLGDKFVTSVMSQISKLRQGRGQSVEDFAAEFLRLTSLIPEDRMMSIPLLISQFREGLLPEIVAALHLFDSPTSMSEMIQYACRAEEGLTSVPTTPASTSSSAPSTVAPVIENKKKAAPVRCYRCSRIGHMARDCRSRIGFNSARRNNRQDRGDYRRDFNRSSDDRRDRRSGDRRDHRSDDRRDPRDCSSSRRGRSASRSRSPRKTR